MAKPKTYKYDLFALLNAIRAKNAKYYRNNMSESEQKAASAYVAMRMLSATTNARQVHLLNELVNRFVFNLGKHHNELLFDLMTICMSNGGTNLKYTNPLLKKATKMPTTQSIIMEYFGYNSIKATDAIKLISNADIIIIAEELGVDNKALKDIKKELRTRK